MVSVLLMGAGASFGSEVGEVVPTPPLGAGLFEALENQPGGQAKTLPDAIKASFKRDFEKRMSDFYEFAEGNIMRFQREVAQYLAKFSPSKSSVYVDLINTLGTKRIVYSTLNYDLGTSE